MRRVLVLGAALGLGIMAACGSSFEVAGSAVDGGVGSLGADGAVAMDDAQSGDDTTGVEDGAVGSSDANVGQDATDSGDAGPAVVANAAGVVKFLQATDEEVAWIEQDTNLRLYFAPTVENATQVFDAGADGGAIVDTAVGLAVGTEAAFVALGKATSNEPSLLGYPFAGGPTLAAMTNITMESVAEYGGSVYTTINGSSDVYKLTDALTDQTDVPDFINASDVHVSGNSIYYTSGMYVYSGSKADGNGSIRLFATPGSKLFAADPLGHVFWVDDSGKLNGCLASTSTSYYLTFCTAVPIATVYAGNAIVSDGVNVYWNDTTTNPGIFSATIDTSPEDAGDAGVSFGAPVKIVAGSDTLAGLALNSRSLFWSEGIAPTTIYQRPRLQ